MLRKIVQGVLTGASISLGGKIIESATDKIKAMQKKRKEKQKKKEIEEE